MSDKAKIIWPIDPHNSNKELDEKLKDFFKNLGSHVEFEIQPVCVMSSGYAQMGEYFEPVNMSELKGFLAKDCQTYVDSFPGIHANKTVILENFHSVRSAEIALFDDYVKDQKPDFVVLSSHGRKGWSRTFLGSFTESFLLRTTVPSICYWS